LQAAAYKVIFYHFVWLVIEGGLHFFLYFIERYRWRSSSFGTFFRPTLFSHSVLFSITCTSVTGGIMFNRRQL